MTVGIPSIIPHYYTLNDHIMSKLENVIYCRYGFDYFAQFQSTEEFHPIGSHKINLDQLIYQKQKML